MKGIDVSYHNGYIDYAKAKADGIDFAMCRAGFGEDNEDSTFKRNMEGFLSVGIRVGSYFFMYSANVQEAIIEADNFARMLEPFKSRITLPVAADFEYEGDEYLNKCGIYLSKSERTAIVRAFLNRMQEHGYSVMNYANLDYLYNKFDDLSEFPLWLADIDSDSPSEPCLMWQHDFHGKVAGLDDGIGEVDLNIFYGAETLTAKDENKVKRGKDYKTMENIGRLGGKELLEVEGNTVILRANLENTPTRARKINDGFINVGENIYADQLIALRRDTTWDSEEIKDVPANSSIKVLEDAPRLGWIKVYYDGVAGFVDAGFIKFR